ncbi:MAG: hypothetical protein HY869_02005 [Chloroflexi bacterium]|nr:hypothetical protein [Chloroflexota bacterium]
MFTPARTKTIVSFFLACLLLLTLSGCSSTYVDTLGPIVDEFNTSVDKIDTQMSILIADNAMFEDAAWQSETSAALSNWKGTAEALTNLPEPEEEYMQLNALIQEMASQAILAADAYKAAIDAGDIQLMNDGGPYMDRVNELLPQINAEINRLNQ